MKLVSTCWAVLLPTRQVGDGQEIRARTDKGIIIAGRRTNRVQPYDLLVTGRYLLTTLFHNRARREQQARFGGSATTARSQRARLSILSMT